MPRSILWAALAFSLAPGLLILLGADFGVEEPDVLDVYIWSGDIDALHRYLRGSFVHSVLEWSGVMVTLIVAGLSMAYFRMSRDVVIPVIGMALLCSGLIDAFHTLAAERLVYAVTDNDRFIPFTWALSRLFNVLVLGVGMGLLVMLHPEGRARSRLVFTVGGVFLVLALSAMYWAGNVQALPRTTFPHQLLTRPYDMVPLVAYLLAIPALFLPLYMRQPTVFTYTLLVSMIPAIMTQIHMAFGSTRLYDAHFNAAHFLKVVSYLVPLSGLVVEYVRQYSELQERELLFRLQAEELRQSNFRLNQEVEERARAELQMEQQAEVLRSTNEELEQFAFIAAHDLREPLRKITVFATRLESRLAPGADARTLTTVHSITGAAQRMMQLLDSLQQYSRVTSRSAGFTRISLNQVVDDVIDDLRILTDDAGATVRRDWLPEISGDPVQLRQLFLHLITNAVQYRRPGVEPEVRIINEHAEEGMCRIVVQDNGAGIEERYFERIFQIFQQLQRSDGSTSTGAGLSLCRKICERHDGSIELESEVGVGSRFIVTLPLNVQASPRT